MSFKPRCKKTQRKNSVKKGSQQIIRDARRKQPSPVKVEIPPEIYAQVARTEEETPEGRLPATLLHEPGRPSKDSLVVMRLETFQRYFDAKPTDVGGDQKAGNG